MILFFILYISKIFYIKNTISIRKICRFAPLLLGIKISHFSLLEFKTRLSVVCFNLTKSLFIMRNFYFWLCFSIFIARTLLVISRFAVCGRRPAFLKNCWTKKLLLIYENYYIDIFMKDTCKCMETLAFFYQKHYNDKCGFIPL